MSTRAMARQYSNPVNVPHGSLDFFGLGTKSRLNEYQGQADIDVAKATAIQKMITELEKQLEEVKSQHAIQQEQERGSQQRKTQRQSDNDSILKAHGIISSDESIDDYDTATRPILIKSAEALANAGLGKAQSQSEFYNSPVGSQAVKVGETGLSTKPAFENVRLGAMDVRPGEAAMFPNVNNLLGSPIQGFGSSLTTSRFEPKLDLKTQQYYPFETERQTMGPGKFINPDIIKAMQEDYNSLFGNSQNSGGTNGISTGIKAPYNGGSMTPPDDYSPTPQGTNLSTRPTQPADNSNYKTYDTSVFDLLLKKLLGF